MIINSRKLAELMLELDSYKKSLASKNEELTQIIKCMDSAWEGDSQYEEVGSPALKGIIKGNDEAVELLSQTLFDLEAWLEAVKLFEAKRGGRGM